ncbi:MAG TPA: hypothetical protein VMS22_03225, partial [Candidatus Eisenbacteria bacterium]|nr:hypothetical protein [Candidatus Eisenbacteria bacterium]
MLGALCSVLIVGQAHGALTTRAQCVAACATSIDACATSCGALVELGATCPRASVKRCRRGIIKRCRHQGIASCMAAT